MSTKTTLKTDLRDASSIGKGAEEFLADIIMAQEPHTRGLSVSFDPAATEIKMHGGERATVNAGVISFSDTRYTIGLNEDKDGNVSVVFDSYVNSGQLTKRVNGKSKKDRANLKQAQSLAALQKSAAKKSRRLRTYAKDGQLCAFVPAK